MLMTLGMFVFNIHNASYNQLQRQTAWRFARNERVGKRATSQFLGQGDDTITLSGWVAPDIAGDIASIHELRTMGDRGEPYIMVSGTGTIYGLWDITSLEETQTLFWPNGTPRKVEFSLSLHRVDDEQIKQVGLITNIQELLR